MKCTDQSGVWEQAGRGELCRKACKGGRKVGRERWAGRWNACHSTVLVTGCFAALLFNYTCYLGHRRIFGLPQVPAGLSVA